MLEPLTVRYHDIVSEYNSISHLTGTDRSRRAAWMGGIGILSKTIFGTLNEDDAVKYDNAISNLQDNQKRLGSLIKESVLVTSFTFSKFNETIHNIKINEARLNEAVDNLSWLLKNITQNLNHLNVKTKIISILNSLEATVLALSFRLEDITNAIMFVKQNSIHPAVLPPTQLYNELVNNYRYLPANVKLPITLELRNINILMNTSNVICYSTNTRIIFVIRIPLVSPKDYILYHNIALPTPHSSIKSDTYSFIIPSSKYIAMTSDRSEYCNLESLDECIHVHARGFICNIMTVFPTSAHASCESELLAKVNKQKPSQCNTKTITGNLDIWKPLTGNKWIYVQSKPNKISIDCLDSVLNELTTVGTGIINVPNSCVVYCKTTKLIPKSNVIKINITVPSSDFNIIKDPCCILSSDKMLINNEPRTVIQNVDLDSFTSDNKLKLDSIAKETDKILNQHQIIKYEAHYSVILIIILCVISLFCIFKIFLYFKSNSCLIPRFSGTFRSTPMNPPEPTPEQPAVSETVTPPKIINKRSVEPKDLPLPSIRSKV